MDLPAVADQIERDPAEALRVYKALQPLGARLEPGEVIEACIAATFELLPRATHVAILLRSESDKDRFALAVSRERAEDCRARRRGADPVRASRAVLRRVLADRAAVLTANAQEALSSESILGGQILSILARAAVARRRHHRPHPGRQPRARPACSARPISRSALLLARAGRRSRSTTRRWSSGCAIAEERARGENVYLAPQGAEDQVRQHHRRLAGDEGGARQLERVIDTRATVCIEGETGTGKELIASAIHHQSQRHDKMFVAQNCAALPENLLESELFGHKRGAFTSADSDKKGLFEIADGGTLFLDEMGEMPLTLQAKLLRVLQEGTIRPVGATSEKQVDVRIICATNRDLAAEVEKGRFRQDLYYRLMVFPIKLPPLRERREDIPRSPRTSCKRYAEEYRVELPGFTQDALDALPAYNWPGNIRELENEIQRLVIQAEPGHWIEITDLSPRLRKIEGTVTRIAPQEGHAQGDDGPGRALAPHRGAARSRRQQDQDRGRPSGSRARACTRSSRSSASKVRSPAVPGGMVASCATGVERRCYIAGMTLTLYVGSKRYSSWSLRPYVALVHTGLAFETTTILLDRDDHARRDREGQPGAAACRCCTTTAS